MYTVTVAQGRFTLTEVHLLELQVQVELLQESENHGIELYEQTLIFIQNVVTNSRDITHSVDAVTAKVNMLIGIMMLLVTIITAEVIHTKKRN